MAKQTFPNQLVNTNLDPLDGLTGPWETLDELDLWLKNTRKISAGLAALKKYHTFFVGKNGVYTEYEGNETNSPTVKKFGIDDRSIEAVKIKLGAIGTDELADEAVTEAKLSLELAEEINGKVDSETGKGLSSNDYSNEDKSKLTLLPTSNEISTSLGLKADKQSPSFIGIPTAPTAAASTNTTQIATTEFVTRAVTTETTARTNAISAESTARSTADTKLTNDLAIEVTARENAVNNLNEAIASGVGTTEAVIQPAMTSSETSTTNGVSAKGIADFVAEQKSLTDAQVTQLSLKVSEVVTLEFVESNYVNRARCNTENGTWLKNDGYFGAFFKLNAGVENIKVTTSSQGVIYAFLKDDSFNTNVTDILPHFCNGVTNFVRDEEHKGVTITIDNIPTDCGCIYFYLGKSSSSYNWKPSSVVVNYSKIGGVEKELSNVKSSIGILESSTKAARLENMRGIIDVAYSKGAVGAIGNTIGHFSLMVSRGFKYIKADARITSDNGIILCHDLGYTLDDDGKIVNFSSSNYTPISSMTTSQCKALTFASDNTSHPCELSELLKYAKRKMLVVYLTIRTADSVSIIDSLVKRYSMSGDVIYNIYPKENWNYEGICAALYEKDKNSLICWTAKKGETITLSMLQDAVNSHCSYFCTWGNNSNDATAYRQEEDLTEEMWSYAASHGLHIMSLTQNSAATELSLSRGIIGFQNYILTPIE